MKSNVKLRHTSCCDVCMKIQERVFLQAPAEQQAYTAKTLSRLKRIPSIPALGGV